MLGLSVVPFQMDAPTLNPIIWSAITLGCPPWVLISFGSVGSEASTEEVMGAIFNPQSLLQNWVPSLLLSALLVSASGSNAMLFVPSAPVGLCSSFTLPPLTSPS